MAVRSEVRLALEDHGGNLATADENPRKVGNETPLPAITYFYAVGSILGTVAIVAANKVLFGLGLTDVNCLSLLHFTSIYFFTTLCGSFGMFEFKRLNEFDAYKLSASTVIAITLSNLSLKQNSVGFYQLKKLLIIPCVILLEKATRGTVNYSVKRIFAISLICFGVFLATVSDLQLSSRGIFIGLLAVVCTAQCQIWQHTIQLEQNIGPLQITQAIGLKQVLLSSGFVLLGVKHGLILFSELNGVAWLWLLVSCALAVFVNIMSYGLIGKTSPVAFQIIGQAKIALTVMLGILWFDKRGTAEQTSLKCAGAAVALVGSALYFRASSDSQSSPHVEASAPVKVRPDIVNLKISVQEELENIHAPAAALE